MSTPVLPLPNYLWGMLRSENLKDLNDYELWKINPLIKVGRGEDNLLKFISPRISVRQCIIVWDGEDHPNSIVKVTDHSNNGTYINGVRIKKGHTAVLKHGQILAFDLENPEGTIYKYTFMLTSYLRGRFNVGAFKAYDAGRRLGRGGFGLVILGIHKKTGVEHAIKLIKLSDTNPSATSRLFRELSILKMVNHPNICGFIDAIEIQHALHLILEYVNGGNLQIYIKNRPRLPEYLSRHFTLQIAEAVSYLHQKRIVHRDLKPDNILLTKDNPPNVKIADFGLSKAMEVMSEMKTMCGTIWYMAPELCQRPKPESYSNLLDSWSFGVIVFCLLTKLFPFKRENDERNFMVQHVSRKIDWAPLEKIPVSDNAVAFVKKLLELSVSRRMSVSDSLSHPWLISDLPREAVINTHSIKDELDEAFPSSVTFSEAVTFHSDLDDQSLQHLMQESDSNPSIIPIGELADQQNLLQPEVIPVLAGVANRTADIEEGPRSKLSTKTPIVCRGETGKPASMEKKTTFKSKASTRVKKQIIASSPSIEKKTTLKRVASPRVKRQIIANPPLIEKKTALQRKASPRAKKPITARPASIEEKTTLKRKATPRVKKQVIVRPASIEKKPRVKKQIIASTSKESPPRRSPRLKN